MPAPVAASTPASAPVKGSSEVDISAIITSGEADKLVTLVKSQGPQALAAAGFVDAVKSALGEKKNEAARKGAADLISTLCEQGQGHALEPFLFAEVIPLLISETFADKVTPVRQAAVDAVRAVVQVMTSWSTGIILPTLLSNLKDAGKWQVKTGCLQIIDQLIVSAPDQVARLTPEIVPVLAEAIWDTKADVKKAARATLEKSTNLISNKDIERFIPALINALINPVEEVPKTIQLLGATTFVHEVDSPTLSLMVPLLSRGLNERPTATKRKVAVIIDNMTKLVNNEWTVRPFLPKLLPGLIKIEPTVGDPEARGVVNRAIKTMQEVGKVEGDGSNAPAPPKAEPKQLGTIIIDALKENGTDSAKPEDALIVYASEIAAQVCNSRNTEATEWEGALAPYLTLVTKDDAAAKKAANKTAEKGAQFAGGEIDQPFEDEEEGEDLCNCQFSLAYGAKILLNQATLRLKRGHRYGLCGRNGTGKTTLLGAIHNGQVEGFPSPDEVRTFFVAHDIDGSEAETSILEFIKSDTRIQADEAEIKETLAEVGFGEDRIDEAIGSLSGGWKMKLALARAVLFKADILLLDEPTNHLDVLNVAWLENYLKSLTNTTSMIVSHDAGFLNRTITDTLHLNRFKVKRYPGNLDKFVEYVPEAKAYFELDPLADYQFTFPNPPLLDGVKTKEKSIIKMRNVGFQYPTSKKQQLYDINLQVSLSSRVAILGPNGSGKSTLVKILVGEEVENKGGSVWKHPALNIGYVAQHAFHHIDKHLDKTPLEYIVDRYQTGEDSEEWTKASAQLTAEDEEKMKQGANMTIEGQKRVIEDIHARKKLKQSYEYEISFVGMSSADNMWLPRDELIKRGFEKKVKALDSKEAQKAGLLRPLVRKEVESHMADFGLEAEFVTHNSMRGLSGGQKVKVVLAAATWRRPHVIILDEPTNYLDRESLAALISALQSYEGGVLVITHSREFSESLCKEVWAMKDGHLTPSGHNWVEGQGSGPRIDKDDGEEKEVFDAMGNKIDAPKKAKKVTSSEARKKKKERMARRKRGEEVFSDEDEI